MLYTMGLTDTSYKLFSSKNIIETGKRKETQHKSNMLFVDKACTCLLSQFPSPLCHGLLFNYTHIHLESHPTRHNHSGYPGTVETTLPEKGFLSLFSDSGCFSYLPQGKLDHSRPLLRILQFLNDFQHQVSHFHMCYFERFSQLYHTILQYSCGVHSKIY